MSMSSAEVQESNVDPGAGGAAPGAPAPVKKPKPTRPNPRLVKTGPPPPAIWHRRRNVVHALCVAVFVALPFFDVMRFDIPRQRFYLAGQEIWINEFSIIFFALLFLMFVIVGASMLYGRIYCGFMCPQMIFSEASLNLEKKLHTFISKHFRKWSPSVRRWVHHVTFYSLIWIGSVFVSFVFISYFVEPRDLFWRLMSLDVVTAGGIAGAATTVVTFLDFAFVRTKFCTTICPYGYLQGMLGDDHTLIVHYRAEANECVECRKCVRVCPMGIDIRDSPYQMECVHCGECVDACTQIMDRFGKESLIHYTWGEKGELVGAGRIPLLRRIGLRDAKRVIIFAVIIIYASALAVALTLRHDVLVRIAPVRTTLYRVGEDGRIYNTFRMTIANRGREPATVSLSVRDLPDAVFAIPVDAVTAPSGEEAKSEFEISVPAGQLSGGVTHFQVVAEAAPSGTRDEFDMTFITPMGERTQ